MSRGRRGWRQVSQGRERGRAARQGHSVRGRLHGPNGCKQVGCLRHPVVGSLGSRAATRHEARPPVRRLLAGVLRAMARRCGWDRCHRSRPVANHLACARDPLERADARPRCRQQRDSLPRQQRADQHQRGDSRSRAREHGTLPVATSSLRQIPSADRESVSCETLCVWPRLATSGGATHCASRPRSRCSQARA